jgi:ferrous iron transport protein B
LFCQVASVCSFDWIFISGESLVCGLALATLYLGALVIGAVASAILNRMIAKDQSGYFMMELPLYRLPKMSLILTQCFQRTKAYVKRAGPAIFIFAVVIWFATNFPKSEIQENATSTKLCGPCRAGDRTFV